MVAPPSRSYFFYVLPVVLAFTQAVDARSCLDLSSMSLVGSAASRAFPAHPGQACALAEGAKWGMQVRRALSADWLALLNGITPRAFLQYNALALPTALIFQAADPDNGVASVPQASVLAREHEIAKTLDVNAARALSLESHEAEMRNDFFIALELSLVDSAPLLLDKLRRDHRLAYNNNMHDGPAALTALAARYNTANMLKPEATRHDD